MSIVVISIVITASECRKGSFPMLCFVIIPPPSSVSQTSIVRALSANVNAGGRCIQASIVVGRRGYSVSLESSEECGHGGLVGS